MRTGQVNSTANPSHNPVNNFIIQQLTTPLSSYHSSSFLPNNHLKHKQCNQPSNIHSRPSSYKPITLSKYCDNLLVVAPPSNQLSINQTNINNSFYINPKSNQRIRPHFSNTAQNRKYLLTSPIKSKFINVTNVGRYKDSIKQAYRQTKAIQSISDFIQLINLKATVNIQNQTRFSVQSRKKTFSNTIKSTIKSSNIKPSSPTHNHSTLPFNIVGLRPNSARTKQKDSNKNIKKKKFMMFSKNQGQTQSNIDIDKQSMPTKTTLKKNNISNQGYHFGKPTQKTSQEDITKLRILYYKDLIWKVSFNQGFKFNDDNQKIVKFYIGKGNNSRLVRTIMERRWWWTYENKIENANIVWTQLKTYSIYQSQLSNLTINQLLPIQQNWLTDEWLQKRLQSQDKSSLLLTEQNYYKWKTYINDFNNQKKQKKSLENLLQRQNLQLTNNIKIIEKPKKVSNHLQYSRMIGNKKALYQTMKMYERVVLKNQQLKYLPLTFHITNGIQDQEYLRFLPQFYQKNKSGENQWIIKPGEMSNRGKGIKVCTTLQQIKNILKNKQKHNNGVLKSYILQQYITKPLLYKGRKFDIRHYIMITSTQGRIRGYFYQQGYLRTTSYKYTLNQTSASIHLTNDAVQKHCKDYGKYQKGNKLSYNDFQRYVKNTFNEKYSFFSDVYPQIRRISIDVIRASYYLIDPKRRINNFQIFGLDIMVDQDFNTWLIEVNTNPCLELSSPVLAQLIPKMLDNAFSIALDTQFPPPNQMANNKKNHIPENSIQQNMFELVFDQAVLGNKLDQIYQNQRKQIEKMDGYGEDQEAYESQDDQYMAQY